MAELLVIAIFIKSLSAFSLFGLPYTERQMHLCDTSRLLQNSIQCITRTKTPVQKDGLSRFSFIHKKEADPSVAQVTKKLVLEKIPYSVVTTYTNALSNHKKTYVVRGENGVRGKIVATILTVDGRKTTNTTDSWIEKEPVTERVTEGTDKKYKTIVVDGKTIQYWRTLTVVATSYDKTCKGCNDTTATGQRLRKGIIAVDPKVIPLHTQLYVPGYGYGKAEDTGGFIKGNRIDLAYDDIRYGNWSKRTVTIYILN